MAKTIDIENDTQDSPSMEAEDPGRSWSARDLACIWHPLTQAFIAPPPIPIVKAKGAYLYSETGDAYLDAISSWWVNLHGLSSLHPLS